MTRCVAGLSCTCHVFTFIAEKRRWMVDNEHTLVGFPPVWCSEQAVEEENEVKAVVFRSTDSHL